MPTRIARSARVDEARIGRGRADVRVLRAAIGIDLPRVGRAPVALEPLGTRFAAGDTKPEERGGHRLHRGRPGQSGQDPTVRLARQRMIAERASALSGVANNMASTGGAFDERSGHVCYPLARFRPTNTTDGSSGSHQNPEVGVRDC